MMPISCTECRRRKIKCNKLLPCNQCTVKNRQCEYPPKFRSIEIDQLVVEPTLNSTPMGLQHSRESTNIPSINASCKTKPTINSPEAVNCNSQVATNAGKRRKDSSEDQETMAQQLIKENEALKLQIRELKLRTKRQRTKLRALNSKITDYSDIDDQSDGNNSYNKDETNEGENVSADVKMEPSDNYYGPNSTKFMISSSVSKSHIGEFDNLIRYKKHQNRSLPQLIDLKRVPNKNKSTLVEENKKLVISLVKKFIHLKVHYVNYMNVDNLVLFLEEYDPEKQWDKLDDEKLMLILMILIVTIRSIPQKDTLIIEYNLSYKKDRYSLYKQYKMLKNTIHHQSTTVLRAYVLECEDLFYNDRIEDSWDSLFLAVSMSYSLGLHVYDSSIVETLQNRHLDQASDVIKNNDKASLWFVVNFISATLCSVLGRPNPVTFTFQPLLRNYEIRLNYKMALAYLINKSTNVLIDSYKVDIDEKLVLSIDEAYVNETKIYEKILIDTRIMKNLESRDVTRASFIALPVVDTFDDKVFSTRTTNLNGGIGKNSKIVKDCPLDIRFTILRPCTLREEEQDYCMILEDGDTLCDLILLYGNRAKFNQHFMVQYTKALESCIDSCKNVLDHGLDLIELLYRKMGEPRFHEIYPFFYVFLYQTFVVIYTMLHMSFNKLLPYANDIETIRNKVFKLFDAVGQKTWRSNVVKLIQVINELCDNFFKKIINITIQNDFSKSYNTNEMNGNSENIPALASPSVYGYNPTLSSVRSNDNLRETNKDMTPQEKLAVYNIPENIQFTLEKGQQVDNNGSGPANNSPYLSQLAKVPSFSKMSMTYLSDLINNNNHHNQHNHTSNHHNNFATTQHSEQSNISESPSVVKLLELSKKYFSNEEALSLSPNIAQTSYSNMLDLNDPFHIQFPFNFQHANGEHSEHTSTNGDSTKLDNPDSV